MQFNVVQTAWGWFGYVASQKGLVATYLPREERVTREMIRAQWPEAVESSRLLPSFAKQVKNFYVGKKTKFDVALDLSNVPPFRAKVLKACHAVPFAQTSSYADLARAVGNPNASRAVGGAMANNPLPLVVPCHRVLRSDGSLGGFSSPDGVREKERLLMLEGAKSPVKEARGSRKDRRRVA